MTDRGVVGTSGLDSETDLMREIGGYLELERNLGPVFHGNAIALNSGRNALACIIESRRIERLLVPDYLCDSVAEAYSRYPVEVRTYNVGLDLRPVGDIKLHDGEWLYVVNYFGQLFDDELRHYADRYGRVVFDFAQAFFAYPVDGADTLYTCRKFFGVPDGAYLYSDTPIPRELERSVSYNRCAHLVGRFEVDASSYYQDFCTSQRELAAEGPMAMSSLTENMLRGIDYERVRTSREANFAVLASRLAKYNELQVRAPVGPFAYPLLVPNGREVRAALHRAKAYVSTLWPNVIAGQDSKSDSYRLSADLLPLPVDQRYVPDDMHDLADLVEERIAQSGN